MGRGIWGIRVPLLSVRTELHGVTVNRWARRPSAAFAVLIALSLFLGLALMRTPTPKDDSIRYISYALNLHDYGVFSATRDGQSAPAPQSVHAPLYPAWVALFMHLDPGIRASLGCIVDRTNTQTACSLDLRLLVAAQLVLAGVFFGAVWLLAFRISGNPWIAWLAAGFALMSQDPLSYANRVLTEALLLPLMGLFTVFLVLAYQTKRMRWMLAAGASLALAALTRPAYCYLFLVITATLAGGVLVGKRRLFLTACAAFVLAYGVVVTPWMLRNKLQFDRFALTTGYAGDILAQRVAYDRMGWDELAMAFLYWFPDFGDNIAKAFFPRRYFEKLKWTGDSYYAAVAPALYQRVLVEAKSPDAVLPRLLRTEILAHPVKHVLVSLPLAWRGVFVRKYWGIVGLICFIIVALRRRDRPDHALLVASLPVWFMVAFHALVSVSIPRYNLPLIPLYAYAMAWAAYAAGTRLVAGRTAHHTARATGGRETSR